MTTHYKNEQNKNIQKIQMTIKHMKKVLTTTKFSQLNKGKLKFPSGTFHLSDWPCWKTLTIYYAGKDREEQYFHSLAKYKWYNTFGEYFGEIKIRNASTIWYSNFTCLCTYIHTYMHANYIHTFIQWHIYTNILCCMTFSSHRLDTEQSNIQ